jgi:hypothetical protein
MITKEKIHQIGNFIGQMPEIEVSLKYLVVNYLKLFTENASLKKENLNLKKENNDLLTEAADHARMVKDLQEELDGLKTIH